MDNKAPCVNNATCVTLSNGTEYCRWDRLTGPFPFSLILLMKTQPQRECGDHWMWRENSNKSQVCSREHEDLWSCRIGNERLLCLRKYTSTRNNTNTHTSTSKMLFRTFGGWVGLVVSHSSGANTSNTATTLWPFNTFDLSLISYNVNDFKSQISSLWCSKTTE